MSSLWRKFRSGSTSSQNSDPTPGGNWQRTHPAPPQGARPVSCSPELLAHSPTLTHLITKADEELFLAGDEAKRNDPLQVKAQFVKTVLDILHSPSTLPYFVQFLQGWGADKYARFWLEANSFRTAAATRVIPQSPTRPTTLPNEPPGGVSERLSGKEVCSREGRNQAREAQRDLVLPDLVSNIQNASDVTPLGSPEGVTPDALTCHTPRQDLGGGPKKVGVSPGGGDGGGGKDSSGGHGDIRNTLSAQIEEQKQTQQTPAEETTDPEERLGAQKPQRSIADDALTIYNKYLAKDADCLVAVDEGIAGDVGCRISAAKQDVDPDCFLLAQEAVVAILEREHLPKFLSSDYYLKHQIDVLTSGSVRLADIIYSDSAFPYFMEYVEQEGGQSMLQFWVAVSNFRQQLLEADPRTHDPAQAQADAMILYDKYFSLQATCPQGFSDKVRFLIEGNICQESGPPPTCFDLPLRVVLHILERDFLPGYLSSSLHISYLSELINTVKSSVELFGRKKRTGSESTCSSEQSSSSISISTQNTLLAMDSSAAPTCRVKSLADPSSMRIDASQLNDPDSLWRRKNFSKLSCGFVNELGRFEAEIEAHPYQRQPSSGLQKIRRLMGREEDKVKEDMAYQVAEMIIKDVTQVTLGPKGRAMPSPPPPPS
ncbi:A-kinase anchor protein 10, mitochondrial-like [Eriocheir sinensis]|uniref:A-kinase anchor protein 10, mitochondrial-like n=1 Tax=Eriocheir sinensis TaxID=95602 RepID=UPI0021C7E121|nr:A-kinase anchor protein 10, mitochondrial-like [Eriocheir sinensis]